MYGLIKLEKEIESVSLEEIQWDTVMMVDPRDYVIHEYNIRTFDPERGIKSLEDSILKNGYRYPCLSDENKNIIDGGRRWRIAIKHGFKMPMIHVLYGEGDEANVERAIDSMIGNMSEPNSPKEIGFGIKRLIEDMHQSISQVADRLGVTYKEVNDLYTGIKAPKELFPDENPDVVEEWEGMTPRSRERFKTIIRSTSLSPAERAIQIKEYVELTNAQQDAAAREIHAGLKVDMKDRIETVKSKDYTHIEHDIKNWIIKLHQNNVRMRGWDLEKTYITFILDMHFNPGFITQQKYAKYTTMREEQLNDDAE